VQAIDILEDLTGTDAKHGDLGAHHGADLSRNRADLADRQKFGAPITGCECAGMGETLFSSTYTPDPRSALDVLAFVLTPVEAFADGGDADEMEAVAELLGAAKSEAVERWYSLHTDAATN
jgi:hypothetical protein